MSLRVQDCYNGETVGLAVMVSRYIKTCLNVRNIVHIILR